MELKLSHQKTVAHNRVAKTGDVKRLQCMLYVMAKYCAAVEFVV